MNKNRIQKDHQKWATLDPPLPTMSPEVSISIFIQGFSYSPLNIWILVHYQNRTFSFCFSIWTKTCDYPNPPVDTWKFCTLNVLQHLSMLLTEIFIMITCLFLFFNYYFKALATNKLSVALWFVICLLNSACHES